MVSDENGDADAGEAESLADEAAPAREIEDTKVPAAAVVTEAVPAVTGPAVTSTGETGYVPMSEWLDDLER